MLSALARLGGPASRVSRGRFSAMQVRAQSGATKGYYALLYKYVPDILEKRGPYREQHLAGARQMLDAGKMVMAGALAEPVDGALFIFKDVTKDEVESFVKADPYVKNGLVPSYEVRPYMVVVGPQ